MTGQEREPASTGPMRAGWNDRTGPTLTALQRLRDETNRAMDAVQVGAPVPLALTEAWRELEAVS